MTQQEFFERYKYSVKTDRIGGGGFGTVYRATDKSLHRKVAIKVSEVKIIGDKEFSLKAEFDAVGKLPPHQNIAHYEELYSFDEHNGVFDYAVMQYYEDGNLKQLLESRKLTFEQKEKIAEGILDGISFLHGNKVVHRDLKPANILICREGDDYVPLITDFGLSKGVEEMSKSGFTNSVAGGSPGYMSPEQIKGGIMQLNTDLWSYGVMVYELFSGRRLFQSLSPTGSTTEVNEMILHKDISAEIAALPGKWREVAERCLVRDNRQRAKSAEELYGIINGGVEGTGHFGYDEVTVVDDPKPQPGLAPRPKQDVTVIEGKGDGKTFTVNGVTFEMVAVKGGTFTMGATSEQGSDAFDNEKPAHSVTLGDYYIGKFEVTQELWEAVMGSNPSYFNGGKLPVERVSWYEAVEFCNRLSEETGRKPYYSIDRSRKDPNNESEYDKLKWTVRVNPNADGFRLPTEAEWEYAARGGSKSRGYKYSGSNSIGDVAWYKGNSGSKTHPVGTKTPNELGIYDMSGNVYEWCQDWKGNYGSGSQTNPQGPSSGSRRVYRGGSWFTSAQFCRVSNRNYSTPSGCVGDLGFRLVVSQ